MRGITASVVGAAALLVACSAHAAEIKWAKSYQAALAQAKASNKLVMVDFYTDW